MNSVEQSFSSFSPALLWEKRNRALLVQVLVSELLAVYRGLQKNAPLREIVSTERQFFPYDWAIPYGHLNKAQEHAKLLSHVFSELAGSAMHLRQLLHKTAPIFFKSMSVQKEEGSLNLPQLFFALEPFFRACRENENLIFFLLKHKEEIESFMKKGYLHAFLLSLHPAGLFDLCKKLCDNYHYRGFYFLIPEIKRLFSDV